MLDDEDRKEMLRERIAKENAFQLYKRYSERRAAEHDRRATTLRSSASAAPGWCRSSISAAARSPTWAITSPISFAFGVKAKRTELASQSLNNGDRPMAQIQQGGTTGSAIGGSDSATARPPTMASVHALGIRSDNGSGIRTLNGDQLFPQNSNCAADEVSSGCEWGLSVFDVRHRIGLVDPLRAAVRRGQAVHAGRRRGRDPWGLAVHQHPEPVERFPEEPADRAGSRRTWVTEIRDLMSYAGQDPNDGPNTILAVVQHSSICAAAGGRHLWRRACGTCYPRTGDLQFRHVDPAELHARGAARACKFRLEAFNVFNQPVWQDPTTAVTAALYGQINATRKPMRELQLGVKFGF